MAATESKSTLRYLPPSLSPPALSAIIAVTLGLFSSGLAVSVADEPKSQPFPQPSGKKGLQVQMIDDAIALGIHHAASNINLTVLLQR